MSHVADQGFPARLCSLIPASKLSMGAILLQNAPKCYNLSRVQLQVKPMPQQITHGLVGEVLPWYCRRTTLLQEHCKVSNMPQTLAQWYS